MTIRDEIIDELLSGQDPQAVFAKDGLLDALKKALAERVLNAELDHHLAEERAQAGSVSFRACSEQQIPGLRSPGSSSFQHTESDGCPAHVVKPPRSGGNVLAHPRTRAEEVPEFVVTAAISSG